MALEISTVIPASPIYRLAFILILGAIALGIWLIFEDTDAPDEAADAIDEV